MESQATYTAFLQGHLVLRAATQGKGLSSMLIFWLFNTTDRSRWNRTTDTDESTSQRTHGHQTACCLSFSNRLPHIA